MLRVGACLDLVRSRAETGCSGGFSGVQCRIHTPEEHQAASCNARNTLLLRVKLILGPSHSSGLAVRLGHSCPRLPNGCACLFSNTLGRVHVVSNTAAICVATGNTVEAHRAILSDLDCLNGVAFLCSCMQDRARGGMAVDDPAALQQA
jgi:hypothetical protein